MQPRVTLITLGVPDLDEARRFYVDGLGWQPTLDVPGEIVFLQVGHGLVLGLWGIDDLERDIGDSPTASRADPAPPPFSLAHNVDTEEEVAAVLAAAVAAGGTILKDAQRADFGGFHGYFADPAGFRWEVAHNPGWSVAEDGRVTIGAVE